MPRRTTIRQPKQNPQFRSVSGRPVGTDETVLKKVGKTHFEFTLEDTPIVPGSIRIVSDNAPTSVDDCHGVIYGETNADAVTGTSDYETGLVKLDFKESPEYTNDRAVHFTVTYKCYASIQEGVTTEVGVGDEHGGQRIFNFTTTNPLIVPGLFQILTEDNIEVTDDLEGGLESTIPGLATGSINYETGVGTVEGSTGLTHGKVIWVNYTAYLSELTESQEVFGNTGSPAESTFTVTPTKGDKLKRNGVRISMVDSAIHAIDDGEGNMIGEETPGDVTGTVDYDTREISITYTATPAENKQLTIDYTYYQDTYNVTNERIGVGVGLKTFAFSLDEDNIVRESLSITGDGTAPEATDDGDGVLEGTGVTGSIDYTEGDGSVTYNTPVDDSETLTATYDNYVDVQECVENINL